MNLPNDEDSGLLTKAFKGDWDKTGGTAISSLQQYYPCYGAILEVTVAPVDKSVSLEKYPYFLDFEPKKRELYELVSDTKETMSRSQSDLEIGKSNSSLKSHEVVDIDKGWSGSYGAKVGDIGYDVAYSSQVERGSRNVTQSESKDFRNTDASQEMRETQSHTTQLSQMYHLLDGYHVGTNRALFFINGRPHTTQTPFTFVNGPRILEGIQDFILVVIRPKAVSEICVEAYLETGHIGQAQTSVDINGSEITVPWNDQFQANVTDQSSGDQNFKDNAIRIWKVTDHYPEYSIKSVKLFTCGPPSVTRNNPDSTFDGVKTIPHITFQDESQIQVSGWIIANWHRSASLVKNIIDNITYPFNVEILLVKKETVDVLGDILFITGRKLCCCPVIISLRVPDGIAHERPMKKRPGRPKLNPQEMDSSMPIAIANRIGGEIREAMIASRNDSENRYESFVKLRHTNFVSQILNNALVNRENATKINSLTGVSDSLKSKLKNLNEDITTKDLLPMSFKMLMDVFGLSHNEAMELKDHLTGFSNSEFDLRKKWLNDQELQRLFKQQ